jgi:hypothetical protein
MEYPDLHTRTCAEFTILMTNYMSTNVTNKVLFIVIFRVAFSMIIYYHFGMNTMCSQVPDNEGQYQQSNYEQPDYQQPNSQQPNQQPNPEEPRRPNGRGGLQWVEVEKPHIPLNKDALAVKVFIDDMLHKLGKDIEENRSNGRHHINLSEELRKPHYQDTRKSLLSLLNDHRHLGEACRLHGNIIADRDEYIFVYRGNSWKYSSSGYVVLRITETTLENKRIGSDVDFNNEFRSTIGRSDMSRRNFRR